MKRLATAAVLVPFLVWVVLGAPLYVFLGVIAAIASLAFREYDRITSARGARLVPFA